MSARADATTARDLVQRLVDSVNAAGLETLEEIASGQIAREAANWIGPFRRSFPDFRMDLVDVIAEDDRVVAHFKCAGTHLATGKAGRRRDAASTTSTRSTSSASSTASSTP